MSDRKITITLTEFELKTLLACAGNGFGDGDFYVNPGGKPTGYGDGKRSVDAYISAVRKCEKTLKRGTKAVAKTQT